MKFRAPCSWLSVFAVVAGNVHLLCADTPSEPETPMVDDGIHANLTRTKNQEGTTALVESFRETRKRFREAAALDTSLSYYTLGLAAVGGTELQSGFSGELSLQGVWKPGARWQDHATGLHFRMRHRHAFGDTAASSLGGEIGTFWGLTDGFSAAGFEIPDFFLEQYFERAGVLVRYGQMTVDSQFDKHQLRSSKKSFLNQAFSSNPAVGFPRSGAGVSLVKEFENGWQLAMAATNVQGSIAGEQIDYKLNSDNLFNAVQLGRDFELRNGKDARLQLLVWRSDGSEELESSAGGGVSLTYEQEISADMRAFARLAWVDGGATPVDRLLMGGVGISCSDNGLIGLGIGIGEGNVTGSGIQGVVEGFYRWQSRSGFNITPDVQIVAGNGFNSSPGVRLVAGLRMGIEF
ncbi:MAG: carbohydrate porin [Akkermansiaceae bacterium]